MEPRLQLRFEVERASLPLAEWLERRRRGEPIALDLNGAAMLDLWAPGAQPEQTESLFGYTACSAGAMAAQFDAARARLSSGRMALLGQALIGAPQNYYLALEPEAGQARLSAVFVEGGPRATSIAAPWPGWVTEADADSLHAELDSALPWLHAAGPGRRVQTGQGVALLEHDGARSPLPALLAALEREAACVREAYAALGQKPGLDTY
jgi:hypothetical protein